MSATEDPRGGSPAETEVQDRFRLGWRYVRRALPDGGERWERVPLTAADILHPQEEDFIAQNDFHAEDCRYLRDVLGRALKGRPGARALFDCRVDWGVEGVEPLGPDLTVLFAVPKDWDRKRATFEVGKYGARPAMVIEVTSPTTRDTDLGPKVTEYERAGVPLYVIVDELPGKGERRLRLLAYRASPEGYQEVAANEEGRIWLEPVKLWLGTEGERAVCYDETGQPILTGEDLEQTAREATERAEQAESEAQEARSWAEAEAQASREARSQARAAEEARAQAETEARRQVEARAEAETRARQLAEQLAQSEARSRQLAEQLAEMQKDKADAEAQALRDRVQELEAELRRQRGEG